MNWRSAIYAGDVTHVRLRPHGHRHHYRVFSMLLDLDELSALSASSRVFGYNRPALFSFRDEDHGDGRRNGLRDWVESHIAAAGTLEAGMRISVLCYPRILGYVFNPLTLYFCHTASGSLRTILYEVCNTFGEKHTYVIAVADESSIPLQHSCAKEMYVSPFIPMACLYHFHIVPPGEKILIRIDEEDEEGPLLIASFAGRREAISDRSMCLAFLRYPLMTLKVTAGIYWEALRIWRKGIPVHQHQAAANQVNSTIVRPVSGQGTHEPR